MLAGGLGTDGFEIQVTFGRIGVVAVETMLGDQGAKGRAGEAWRILCERTGSEEQGRGQTKLETRSQADGPTYTRFSDAQGVNLAGFWFFRNDLTLGKNEAARQKTSGPGAVYHVRSRAECPEIRIASISFSIQRPWVVANDL